MQIADFVWTLIGFVLTLMILSYIIGDNPLFRIATYIFVGASAGYVTVILIYQVIYPRMILPIIRGSVTEKLIAFIPLLLALLFLSKLSPKMANLGKLPMAYLVGAGAAVILGGAIFGTIFPQIQASISPFDLKSTTSNLGIQLIEGVFMLVGTITTLVYFQFSTIGTLEQGTVKFLPIITTLRQFGKVFIGFTLGAIFAGIIAASLTALIERLGFLWTFIFSLM